jgi:hypothetical protein
VQSAPVSSNAANSAARSILLSKCPPREKRPGSCAGKVLTSGSFENTDRAQEMLCRAGHRAVQWPFGQRRRQRLLSIRGQRPHRRGPHLALKFEDRSAPELEPGINGFGKCEQRWVHGASCPGVGRARHSERLAQVQVHGRRSLVGVAQAEIGHS